MCLTAHSIRNSPESNEFHLVLFVCIVPDPPVSIDFIFAWRFYDTDNYNIWSVYGKNMSLSHMAWETAFSAYVSWEKTNFPLSPDTDTEN